MNEHWEYKQSRSKQMSNKNISKWYYDGLKNGAIGGKLVGAGGGGFLMFYTNNLNYRHKIANHVIVCHLDVHNIFKLFQLEMANIFAISSCPYLYHLPSQVVHI